MPQLMVKGANTQFALHRSEGGLDLRQLYVALPQYRRILPHQIWSAANSDHPATQPLSTWSGQLGSESCAALPLRLRAGPGFGENDKHCRLLSAPRPYATTAGPGVDHSAAWPATCATAAPVSSAAWLFLWPVALRSWPGHRARRPRQTTSLPPPPAPSAKADPSNPSHTVGSCYATFPPGRKRRAPRCASPPARLQSESRDPSPTLAAPGRSWPRSCPQSCATWFGPTCSRP